MIAALYVQTNGCYFDLDGVDPWDEERDARLYDGPHPVVAHPPCARWGRYYSGGPSWIASGNPPKILGDDGGCFKAALVAVRKFGGVLEHPKDSQAWAKFGLPKPPMNGGWMRSLYSCGWSCCIDQQHYGHPASKPTWLYWVGRGKPANDLIWGCPRVDRGKRGRLENLSKRQRAATPDAFRDLLIGLAETGFLIGGGE